MSGSTNGSNTIPQETAEPTFEERHAYVLEQYAQAERDASANPIPESKEETVELAADDTEPEDSSQLSGALAFLILATALVKFAPRDPDPRTRHYEQTLGSDDGDGPGVAAASQEPQGPLPSGGGAAGDSVQSSLLKKVTHIPHEMLHKIHELVEWLERHHIFLDGIEQELHRHMHDLMHSHHALLTDLMVQLPELTANVLPIAVPLIAMQHIKRSWERKAWKVAAVVQQVSKIVPHPAVIRQQFYGHVINKFYGQARMLLATNNHY